MVHTKRIFTQTEGFCRIFVETRLQPSWAQQPGAGIGTAGDSRLNSLYWSCLPKTPLCVRNTQNNISVGQIIEMSEIDWGYPVSVSCLAGKLPVWENTQMNANLPKQLCWLQVRFLTLTLLVQIGNPSTFSTSVQKSFYLQTYLWINFFHHSVCQHCYFYFILFDWKAELVQGVISKIFSWLVSDIKVLCCEAWKRKIAVLCEEFAWIGLNFAELG